MQEVSCGEALYVFWHIGETVCSQLFKTLQFHRSEQRAFSDAMKLLKEEITAFIKYDKEKLKSCSIMTP